MTRGTWSEQEVIWQRMQPGNGTFAGFGFGPLRATQHNPAGRILTWGGGGVVRLA